MGSYLLKLGFFISLSIPRLCLATHSADPLRAEYLDPASVMAPVFAKHERTLSRFGEKVGKGDWTKLKYALPPESIDAFKKDFLSAVKQTPFYNQMTTNRSQLDFQFSKKHPGAWQAGFLVVVDKEKRNIWFISKDGKFIRRNRADMEFGTVSKGKLVVVEIPKGEGIDKARVFINGEEFPVKAQTGIQPRNGSYRLETESGLVIAFSGTSGQMQIYWPPRVRGAPGIIVDNFILPSRRLSDQIRDARK